MPPDQVFTFTIDPNLLILPAGYWFGHVGLPEPYFFDSSCPGQYAGQSVEALLIPLELDGSAEITVNADWCTGNDAFVQPLPAEPLTAQPIKIAPGFDELAGERELIFPVNDGNVRMTVRVERILTLDRPDYS